MTNKTPLERHSKLFGLTLVLLVCTIITLPLANSYFTGAADSKYYLNLLTDFLTQSRSGIFPVYVGQTGNNFNGSINIVRFPYFFILGAIIDLFTFHRLNFLLIQHLIAIISVFSGALIFYFLLLLIDAKKSIQAAILSCLVTLCPGIIGTLYTHDMYASITAFGPTAAVIGALGLILKKKHYPLSYIGLGASLSLAWMSHPPIALWATTVIIIFSITFLSTSQRRWIKIKGFILTSIVFATLSSWYFITIFSTGGTTGTQHIHSSKIFALLDNKSLELITGTGLEIHYDGAFQPIPPSGSFNPSGAVHLGYSLWILLILAGYRIIKRRDWCLLPILLPFITLTSYLYPPSGVKTILWSVLPNVFSITLFPYQRFFYILAPLSALLFYMSGKVSAAPTTSKSSEKLSILFLCLLLFWSYKQTERLRGWFTVQLPANSTDIKTKLQFARSLTLPENVNTQTDTGQRHDEIDFYFDPQLHNQVLESDAQTPLFDNTAWLEAHCEHLMNAITLDHSVHLGEKVITKSNTLPLFSNQNYLSDLILTIDLPPHIGTAVFFRTKLDNSTLNISVKSDRLLREYSNVSEQDPKRLKFIPLWHTTENTVPINLTASHNCNGATLECEGKIQDLCIAKYSKELLPIKVDSIFPYQARVYAPQDKLILQTHRRYVNGYRALVNNVLTPYIETSEKYLGVPLIRGDNFVTLEYVGTSPMKMSFFITCVGWLAMFAYSIRQIKK